MVMFWDFDQKKVRFSKINGDYWLLTGSVLTSMDENLRRFDALFYVAVGCFRFLPRSGRLVCRIAENEIAVH